MRGRGNNPIRTRPPLALSALQEAVELVFGGDERVDAVALFGSYARRRVRGPSDVDVAVLLNPAFDGQADAWALRNAWEEELSRHLGGHPVHVTVLPHAPLILRRTIHREGQVLLERRPGAWQQFRHRVVNEWRDRARVRERFWQRFLQRWEEVGFGERYGDHSAALDAMRRVRSTFEGDRGGD